ncbi:hypothetical protein GLOIN_2v1777993 [Rhizophagus clarus]|uniref:Uncharacterized protein n=1 Tax=Rhizophagus clarus TaxID=94130 RepID=A0A8H3QYL6_9GLOM|nr:hypothetical protein GLOIN_2v1777993 [Rhizophagus clarus]
METKHVIRSGLCPVPLKCAQKIKLHPKECHQNQIIGSEHNNNDDIYSDDDEQASDLTEAGKYNLFGNRDGPVDPNY